MLKKQTVLTLCLLFTLFVNNAKAQDSTKHTTTYLDKGTWLLGGNLSYLNVRTTYISNGGFGGTYGGAGYGSTISSTEGLFLGSISAAKMLNPYFAIGGKATYIDSGGDKYAAFLGPTLRIYINNEGKSILPFMLGELNFSTKKGGTTNYNAGLGLSCFFNKQVSFDVTATYGNKFSINEIPQKQYPTESYGIFALQVGLQIFLPTKK